MNKGKIVQVLGPVVDVLFEHNNLPDIKDALEVDNAGKRCVMEVAQHIGNDTVRCIMLASSEGLYRGMEVIATGSGTVSYTHLLFRIACQCRQRHSYRHNRRRYTQAHLVHVFLHYFS